MSLQELLGEELFKQVAAKIGDKKIAVVNDGNWLPKEKFDEVNTNLKELKKQLKDRDDQLQELGEKAKGHEELTAKISELTEANQKIASDYEAKIQKQSFDFALNSALTGAKARNPKAVSSLLDMENLKLDGEKIIGLDEQLKTLQESDPYLFEVEEEKKGPKFSNGDHKSEGGLDAFASVLLGKQE